MESVEAVTDEMVGVWALDGLPTLVTYVRWPIEIALSMGRERAGGFVVTESARSA